MKSMLKLLMVVLLAAPTLAQGADDPSAARIKTDMAYLASDRLKGREAGSAEYDIAARYVMDQMKQIGLQPAGDKSSYLQHVPLVADRPTDQGRMTLMDKSGRSTVLTFGKDYLVGGLVQAQSWSMQAPLVFVGFGLVAPEHGRDDYRGLDVR